MESTQCLRHESSQICLNSSALLADSFSRRYKDIWNSIQIAKHGQVYSHAQVRTLTVFCFFDKQLAQTVLMAWAASLCVGAVQMAMSVSRAMVHALVDANLGLILQILSAKQVSSIDTLVGSILFRIGNLTTLLFTTQWHAFFSPLSSLCEEM